MYGIASSQACFDDIFSIDNTASPHDQSVRIMSTLAWAVRCKIPLGEALVTLQQGEGAPSFLKSMSRDRELSFGFRKAAEDLQSGLPLSQALTHLKKYLPPYVQPAIRESEKRHSVDKVIPVIATQMRYSANVHHQRKASLTYPFIMFLQSIGILCGTVFFILPQFQRIFGELYVGKNVPKIVQIMMSFSTPTRFTRQVFGGIFRDFYYMSFSSWFWIELLSLSILVLISLLIVMLFIMAVKLIYKLEPFARLAAELFLLHIPFIGRDMKRMALFEFAAGMACYTEAGLDIVEAAELSAKSVSQAWMRRRISRFAEKTRNGAKWCDAWDELGLDLPFYSWLARNAASREKATDGFMQMIHWLKDDISDFSRIFIRIVGMAVHMLNAFFVGFIVLSLGYGIFHLIYIASSQIDW